MKNNFFVYGTLLFPEIIFALTGKSFEARETNLQDYKCFKISDNESPRSYPAIIKSTGDFVKGKILFDVDKDSAEILDSFEDVEYEKEIVTIMLDDKSFEAVAYVWKDKFRDKLKDGWNEKEWNLLNSYRSLGSSPSDR